MVAGGCEKAFTTENLTSPNNSLNGADCILPHWQRRKEFFQLFLKTSQFNQNVAEYIIFTEYLVLW